MAYSKVFISRKGKTFIHQMQSERVENEICNYMKKISDEYDFNKETIVTVGGSEAIDIALR